MSWLGWIVFGAVAGWVASLIVGSRDRRSGCLVNIAVGIVGAALGGFVYQAITGRFWDFSWSLESFAVAVLGAILLLLVVTLATSARRR